MISSIDPASFINYNDAVISKVIKFLQILARLVNRAAVHHSVAVYEEDDTPHASRFNASWKRTQMHRLTTGYANSLHGNDSPKDGTATQGSPLYNSWRLTIAWLTKRLFN
jgi:hypothetical protein